MKPISRTSLKVALVHEWLAGMRGAERVLEVFYRMYTEADVFTLFHVPGSVSKEIEAHRIFTSFLQGVPGISSLYRYLLPIMPYAVESFRFDNYDLVISCSSCVAKGVIVPQNTRHISYVYSPMRYGWDLSGNYFGEKAGHGNAYFGLVNSLLHPLRVWDTASWNRPDQLIAVSSYIATRLKKVSRRESPVIYPPVNTEFFNQSLVEPKKDYFLLITAFEPNRRPDVAIRVCTEANIPLKVVGSLGRHANRCKAIAGPRVEFLGTVTDEALRVLYGEALGLLVPGIEDFGIAPVEALSAGTPVIVWNEGGAREIIEGNELSSLGYIVGNESEMKDAILRVQKGWKSKKWNRRYMAEYARKFSSERFITEFEKAVSSMMKV